MRPHKIEAHFLLRRPSTWMMRCSCCSGANAGRARRFCRDAARLGVMQGTENTRWEWVAESGA